jgi:iron complex outermembrane recepter protein
MNAAYQFKHERSVTATSPPISLLNTPGKPVSLRFRADTGWTNRIWGTFLYMNYVNHYTDDIAVPAVPIASWTTFDTTLRFDGAALEKDSWLKGFTVALSAENVFDRKPPVFLSSDTALGFDGANANPFGRILSVRLVMRW